MTSLEKYLSTFTEHQRFVQSIAIQMLGSSYNLAKSNGFRSWQSKQEPESQTNTNTNTAVPSTNVEQTPIKPVASKEQKEIIKVKKGRNPRVKPIYKKLLNFLERSFDEGAVCLEGVAPFGLSRLPNTGGVYWLTNESNVLFLGTTSDLRKNVMLAIKSIRKKSYDESLTNAITQLIDNKYSIGPAELCVVYLETDDAKKRIRIKNKVKSESSFKPTLE